LIVTFIAFDFTFFEVSVCVVGDVGVTVDESVIVNGPLTIGEPWPSAGFACPWIVIVLDASASNSPVTGFGSVKRKAGLPDAPAVGEATLTPCVSDGPLF
jgi:hypothetical protein